MARSRSPATDDPRCGVPADHAASGLVPLFALALLRTAVSVPAPAFRRGRNTLTFEYSHVTVPARVFPGSPDPRRLAVAFASVVLAPAR